MDEAKEKLRADFYAKTDITPGEAPCSWKEYAEWLEELNVEKINGEILRKNEKLIKLLDNVIEILEVGIAERP